MEPRRTLGLHLLALSLAASGCMTAAPRCRVEGRCADVRAAELDLAARVADDADRATEWIRAVCPETRSERPEVWVVERIAPFRGFPLNEETDGLHLECLWIERIYVTGRAERGALAHELGHFLLGSRWEPLPPFVEEGLSNWFHIHQPGSLGEERRKLLRGTAALALGGELLIHVHAPELARARVRFSSALPGPEGVARHSSSALVFEGIEQRLAAHAHGYVLAERVIERQGLEGLLELCRRATSERRAHVPLAWLYEAAGLADCQALGREHLRSLRPDELELLVEYLSERILQFLSEQRGLPLGSEALASWMSAARPVVAIPGTERSVELMGLPAVAGAL